MKRAMDYIKVHVDDSEIEKILLKYSKENLHQSGLPPLHFNKGIVGRYKSEMSPKDSALFNRNFGDYLIKMGYPLE